MNDCADGVMTEYVNVMMAECADGIMSQWADGMRTKVFWVTWHSNRDDGLFANLVGVVSFFCMWVPCDRSKQTDHALSACACAGTEAQLHERIYFRTRGTKQCPKMVRRAAEGCEGVDGGVPGTHDCGGGAPCFRKLPTAFIHFRE